MLAPDALEFVQQKIAEGAYASPDEALNAAVREWQTLDADPLPIDSMRRLVSVGIEQEKRGEYAPLDIEATIAAAKALLAEKRASQ